ncbi:uncharacterized protein B0T23DRAFT_28132 [Neurospora hispaniola]|uniref:Uncharacterized protein n=1 Tax=Neurospora hispaniola TaxID=588809 RepID=A0AAJ0MVL4_9PEZI|nr:hypothetical protein B0T23DRAFT_28132 [Neurospora hispaniola]
MVAIDQALGRTLYQFPKRSGKVVEASHRCVSDRGCFSRQSKVLVGWCRPGSDEDAVSSMAIFTRDFHIVLRINTMSHVIREQRRPREIPFMLTCEHELGGSTSRLSFNAVLHLYATLSYFVELTHCDSSSASKKLLWANTVLEAGHSEVEGLRTIFDTHAQLDTANFERAGRQ